MHMAPASCTDHDVNFIALLYPTQSPVSVWRLTTFLLPLMLALAVQRASRPVVNLLVARSATSQCAADTVRTHYQCV